MIVFRRFWLSIIFIAGSFSFSLTVSGQPSSFTDQDIHQKIDQAESEQKQKRIITTNKMTVNLGYQSLLDMEYDTVTVSDASSHLIHSVTKVKS